MGLRERKGRHLLRLAVVRGEGRLYDRSMQKQPDVNIRSLREKLRAYGAEEIMRSMLRS